MILLLQKKTLLPSSFLLSQSEFQWRLHLGLVISNDMVPMLESRDRWRFSNIILGGFFYRESVSGREPVERGNEEDDAPLSQLLHQTIFVDHSQGDGVTINPRSTLSMRIQKNEVA